MSEPKREYVYNTRLPTRSMPSVIINIAPPKIGKSVVTAKLTTDFAPKKSQVITLGDEDGYANLEVNEINFTAAHKFEKYLDDLIVDQPFDFIILDNLSVLNEWAEKSGTLAYMNSIQGKNFNLKARLTNPKATGPGLTKDSKDLYFLPGDDEYRSVYTLPDGAGYRLPRVIAIRWYRKLKKCAPYVILNAHPKIDRHTKDDKGTLVNSSFLDMTSGIGRFICKDVDAMASMFRKKKEGFFSFKHGSSDLDAGTRYSYLEGKTFKISEQEPDTDIIHTFWNEIYPDYKPNK